MTITREQVADLQPGDVVEYHNWDWPNGVTIRGALYTRPHGGLWLGDQHLRMEDGDVRSGDYWKGTLTVVSRAPRPLYVNHPRTEPAPGDVVRVEFGTGYEDDWCMNTYAPRDGKKPWLSIAREDAGTRYEADMVIPRPGTGQMRLLVDGETGQVVPAEQPADPLGHVRTGDPTPESADDEPPCSAGANNFACTRERGHVGQHIAGTGVRNPVAAVWS